MSGRTFTWALVDVAALVLAGVLVATDHAPISVFVSVVATVVSVRAVSKGRDDPPPPAASSGTILLGGAAAKREPPAHELSALAALLRGLAAFGREATRATRRRSLPTSAAWRVA